MSAGFGFNGTGRCFPIWRDYAMCKNASKNPDECVPFFEDYVTCNYGWTDPKNVEVYKRQVALAKEQEAWRNKYGKKMAAHVRTFETEGEFQAWKEQVIAEREAAGQRTTVVERDSSMQEVHALTKEKLNL